MPASFRDYVRNTTQYQTLLIIYKYMYQRYLLQRNNCLNVLLVIAVFTASPVMRVLITRCACYSRIYIIYFCSHPDAIPHPTSCDINTNLCVGTALLKLQHVHVPIKCGAAVIKKHVMSPKAAYTQDLSSETFDHKFVPVFTPKKKGGKEKRKKRKSFRVILYDRAT